MARVVARQLVFILYSLFLVFTLTSCNGTDPQSPLEKTFYHWQTKLSLSPKQRGLITGHNRLYVKAFDVIWQDGQARPTAEIQLVDTVGLPTLVPVIFITNEAIRRTEMGDIPALAVDISTFIAELLPAGYPEIQLDCDWTALSRVRYFKLLEAMKRENPELEITCTIRLHQYRDRATQGTPPVERATLMAYNTGDLADWETDNSIVDTTALRYYLAGQPPYPTPLDIAVAVYDWAVVYRRGEMVQLINEPSLAALGDTARFTALSPTRFRVDTTTYLNGLLLYPGDLVRHEMAGLGRVDGEAELLRKYIGGFPGQRLMIYRLGSRLQFPVL